MTTPLVPTDVILKRFETPDEVREMVKGRFEIVRLGGMTIGRATYEPGWRCAAPRRVDAALRAASTGLFASGGQTPSTPPGPPNLHLRQR
jgi:hypothetical protein